MSSFASCKSRYFTWNQFFPLSWFRYHNTMYWLNFACFYPNFSLWIFTVSRKVRPIIGIFLFAQKNISLFFHNVPTFITPYSLEPKHSNETFLAWVTAFIALLGWPYIHQVFFSMFLRCRSASSHFYFLLFFLFWSIMYLHLMCSLARARDWSDDDRRWWYDNIAA